MQLRALPTEDIQVLPPAYDTYFPPNMVFGRRGVIGDGSCFFHAICAAQNTQNYLNVPVRTQQLIGHKFRCAFNTHLTENTWLAFAKRNHIHRKLSLDKIRSHFCKSSHWADEDMIKLFSSIFKLNIIFIDGQNGTVYCGVRGLKEQPLIIIAWVGHAHFEPVFRIKRVNDTQVEAQFVFHHDTDKDVVDYMLRNYNHQCSPGSTK